MAAEVRALVNGYRVSQAIHVAVVLGLSDALADGPLSVAELAERSHSHPPSLYRLLRALASVGVYEQLDGQRFGLTPLGRALGSREAVPAAGIAAFIGRPYHWQAWSALLHSVRTGENAFRSVHGMDVWEYRRRHADEGATFDAAMASQSRFVAAAVLDAYDFGRFSEVADIGGGHGAFLTAVLQRWRDLAGVVFDQAHVVADAPERLRAAGVDDRCRVVSGSFFEAVPGGPDAYVLKYIIHDWEEVDAVAILRTCRNAIVETGTLVLVERVIAGPNTGADTAFSDLNMLVGPGGRERTAEEYAALLATAGFRLTAVVPTASEVSVIEAVPV